MPQPLPWERLPPPPRELPLLLAVRLRLGSLVSQAGWLVLGFGSIFFWAFAWHADLSGWRFRAATAGHTTGVVQDCRQTSYTVGGSKSRRGTPVYENRYRYAVNDEPYQGRSYATGICRAGNTVDVEYLLAQPGFSRIVEMRRDLLGPWSALVAIFPGVGLALAVSGLIKGRRHARLLREGMAAAAGRLVAKMPTNWQTNNKMVYEVKFEYTARNGATGSVTLRTNSPQQFGYDSREMVLYGPEDLRGVLSASLPGKIQVDDRGELTASRSLAFLILPTIAIAGNAWWYITHLWGRSG